VKQKVAIEVKKNELELGTNKWKISRYKSADETKKKIRINIRINSNQITEGLLYISNGLRITDGQN
jgi:hypothetical protein